MGLGQPVFTLHQKRLTKNEPMDWSLSKNAGIISGEI